MRHPADFRREERKAQTAYVFKLYNEHKSATNVSPTVKTYLWERLLKAEDELALLYLP